MLKMETLLFENIYKPNSGRGLWIYRLLETWVWSLGWEDALEKGTATHSSILAWRILWAV